MIIFFFYFIHDRRVPNVVAQPMSWDFRLLSVRTFRLAASVTVILFELSELQTPVLCMETLCTYVTYLANRWRSKAF